jgi:hypothetical protein
MRPHGTGTRLQHGRFDRCLGLGDLLLQLCLAVAELLHDGLHADGVVRGELVEDGGHHGVGQVGELAALGREDVEHRGKVCHIHPGLL